MSPLIFVHNERPFYAINRINGMIGMNFSCGGAHYIDHKTFFSKLDTFTTCGEDDVTEAVAKLA